MARRAAVLAAVVAVAGALGGWKCEVCQDAAATFRKQFPALGVRNMLAPISEGGAEAGAVISPAAPGCTAFPKDSALRTRCIQQRVKYTADPKLMYFIYASLKNNKGPYEICSELGPCRPLPPRDETGGYGALDAASTRVLNCGLAAQTPRCALNPHCAAMKEHCPQACTSCTWLVRSWPQFDTPYCAPEDHTATGGADEAAAGAPAAAAAPGKPATGAAAPPRKPTTGKPTGKFMQMGVQEQEQEEAVPLVDAGMDSLAEAGLAPHPAASSRHSAAAAGGAGGVAADDASSPSLAGFGGIIDAGLALDSESESLLAGSLLETGARSAAAAAAAAAAGGLRMRGQALARDPSVLTMSAWRGERPDPIIPRGRGSPALADVTADAIANERPEEKARIGQCLSLWWSIASSPETWFSLTVENSRLMFPWDPLTACRCMNECPYNSIDSLGVEDACGGLVAPFAQEISARRMLAEAAGIARERRYNETRAAIYAQAKQAAAALGNTFDEDSAAARALAPVPVVGHRMDEADVQSRI